MILIFDYTYNKITDELVITDFDCSDSCLYASDPYGDDLFNYWCCCSSCD